MNCPVPETRASILLVDDTPANLQLLIEALGEQQFEVRPAINGELALASARSHCPDLVLLDINMPGVDGYEVCRRLKADPLTEDVPVLFISSMEETLDKVRAFEAGGVDYISKPFQAEEVLARIKSHLELRNTQLALQQEVEERQRVQNELARHKERLEQEVADRTLELQKRHRALQASEQKYVSLSHQFETLLDAISDPLVLLDIEMQPIWTNSAYDRTCAELGCDQGGKQQTLFHLDSRGKPSLVLRCFRRGAVVEDEIKTPDRRCWGVKAFPLKNRDGAVSQVIVSCVDITEKLRLREEAIRSSRLASLGELSAGIAHEINNPNAVIQLNTPIIRDTYYDAQPILQQHFREQGDFTLAGISFTQMQVEIPAMLDRIEESSQRISRIVEDLKAFVRKEEPEKFSRVDLLQVIRASERLLANPIRKATDHFSVLAEGQELFVKGDFQKLEQIVINLIQNACQALPDRSRSVQLRVFRQGEQVVIEVRDEGCGIPADQLGQVTDPFFTTKRTTGGTGLGLSVSARLIDEHAGHLEIVSEVDKGSCITVSFPAAPEDVND